MMTNNRNQLYSSIVAIIVYMSLLFNDNTGHAVRSMSINCSSIVDCRTCTLSTDFLIPCQWCVSTRTCISAWTPASSCTESERVAHGYNCPLSPPARFGFLDDFARTRALPFIASASADTEHQIKACLDNNVPDTMLLRRYTVDCDFVKAKCAAILLFSPIDNAIVITFRGTNGAVQTFADAINFMLYTQKDFEPVGGKVVAHFYDAFFQLWKAGLEADLREAVSRHTTAELWIFGHSLGGSLGSLAAAWISRLALVPSERIRFVSFGQPRTGNLAYAQIFDDLVPYKYRIVHKGDCITKLPARIPLSDTSLFHHRYEVWYNNDMRAGEAYEMCESADSALCSASVSDAEASSSATHLQYFNVSLYSWFRTGCASRAHLKLRPARLPFHRHPNAGNRNNVESISGNGAYGAERKQPVESTESQASPSSTTTTVIINTVVTASSLSTFSDRQDDYDMDGY